MSNLAIPEICWDDEESVRLLRAFFCRRRRRGDLYYSGASFERLAGGGDAECRANHFDATDLVAITMLNVSVKPHGALALLADVQGHWRRLLTAIPRDASLEDLRSEDLIARNGPVQELWERLADPKKQYGSKPDGVGSVVAGKLLARKRPHLVPVYDERVKAFFQRPEVDLTFWSDLAAALRADGSALQARLLRLRQLAGIGEDISAIRVLDVIAWMSQGEQVSGGVST